MSWSGIQNNNWVTNNDVLEAVADGDIVINSGQSVPANNNWITVNEANIKLDITPITGTTTRWPVKSELLKDIPSCDLQVTFVSKTDESYTGADDGTITITASTSNPDGFLLSKNGGTSYPFTGTSPFTFTALAPGTYNIAAINADGSCGTSLGSPVVIDAGPSLPLLSASVDVEQMTHFFIYDHNDKGYRVLTELIDPLGIFYGNNIVEAYFDITPFTVSYDSKETYPSDLNPYILSQVLAVSNTPPESSGRGASVVSRIYVKNIFDNYPTLVNLYFKITIIKQLGSAIYTRNSSLLRIVPTPIINFLATTFDSNLVINVRVQKIGTNSYNIYGNYTT